MFTHAELDMASAFASQASIALELVAARKLQDALLLVEERDRIARDLHDHVVQRLFATGLSLSQAVPTLEGAGKERVESAMISIDETIRQIRNTILTLRSAGDDAVTLVDMITDIAMEAERAARLRPDPRARPGLTRHQGPARGRPRRLRPRGDVQRRPARAGHPGHRQGGRPPRPAHAERLPTTASASPAHRRSGLGNLAKRAEQHGGFLECDSTIGHGTTLTWRVPVVRLLSAVRSTSSELGVVLGARPTRGVADLEHLGGEAAQRVGDVADGAGHDHGHAGDGLGTGLDRVLQGVLGDLALAQVVAHRVLSSGSRPVLGGAAGHNPMARTVTGLSHPPPPVVRRGGSGGQAQADPLAHLAADLGGVHPHGLGRAGRRPAAAYARRRRRPSCPCAAAGPAWRS